jgi:hypothetical protein
MLAVILRDEVGGMSDFEFLGDAEGISKYAEPDAEGIIEVCRTCRVLASVRSQFYSSDQGLASPSHSRCETKSFDHMKDIGCSKG